MKKIERKNGHYVITKSIIIGEAEYVLGEHETEEKYVTWYSHKNSYHFGHYINNYEEAKIDLYKRCIYEMDEMKEKYERMIDYLEKILK